MDKSGTRGVGILWRSDRAGDPWAHAFVQRLIPVRDALVAAGVAVEPVAFDDEVVEEVRGQLVGLNAVLVWVDPVMGDASRSGERNRVVLDALLRDVASEGVWVSAHPDVIEKMGTKELLVRTRDLVFGSDTHVYRTTDEFRAAFPERVAAGPRVLKPYKGNAGIGVVKVKAVGTSLTDLVVEIQDAHRRGTDVKTMSVTNLIARCEYNFDDGGGLVDQPFQARITDGMIRCYMVRDEVAGFAHQEPDAAQLASGRVFGLPSKKTMFEASEPRFGALKRTVEAEWLLAMLAALGVGRDELPVLWDADFMHGPKAADGGDTYVLCEINCSSVIPFPASAPGKIADAVSGFGPT